MITFMVGFLVGAYTAQNYDIPNMKVLGTNILNYINSMEKNNNNNKKK